MHFYHPKTKVLFADIDKQTARENGLYKSISALTHMLENPALSEYALNQLAMSCLTMNRNEGESDAELIRRAKEESRIERDESMKIGTEVHDYIEKHIYSHYRALQNTIDTISVHDLEDNSFIPAIKAIKSFRDTFPDAEILAVEENYICHTHRFGCKIDLLFKHNGKICLLDWKTNKFRNNKYQPYESNAWQLAGQSLACADNGIKVDEWYNAGINVDPKSETYGECQIVSWRKKNGEKKVDISRGFEIIPLLSKIWDIQNNFEVII